MLKWSRVYSLRVDRQVRGMPSAKLWYIVVVLSVANIGAAVLTIAQVLYLQNRCTLLSYDPRCSPSYQLARFSLAAIGITISTVLLIAWFRVTRMWRSRPSTAL